MHIISLIQSRIPQGSNSLAASELVGILLIDFVKSNRPEDYLAISQPPIKVSQPKVSLSKARAIEQKERALSTSKSVSANKTNRGGESSSKKSPTKALVQEETNYMNDYLKSAEKNSNKGSFLINSYKKKESGYQFSISPKKTTAREGARTAEKSIYSDKENIV